MDDILLKRNKGLLILQWNVNKWTRNIESKLNYIVLSKKPDIICIQEGEINYLEPNFNRYVRGYESYVMNDGYGKIITLVSEDLIHDIKINCDVIINRLEINTLKKNVII